VTDEGSRIVVYVDLFARRPDAFIERTPEELLAFNDPVPILIFLLEMDVFV
jgi:hypothetical protein